MIGIQRARTNQRLKIADLRPISVSRVPICDTDYKNKNKNKNKKEKEKENKDKDKDKDKNKNKNKNNWTAFKTRPPP